MQVIQLQHGSTSIIFEGSTADSSKTTLQVTDPTADRTITIPNVVLLLQLVTQVQLQMQCWQVRLLLLNLQVV